jgi:uncharacterized protein
VTSTATQQRPAFLARQTFGYSNYFLLALAGAFVVALIPLGAREALKSNSNRAEDWLPKSYAESMDLTWFRNHFVGEQFAVVSWDGCTLGNTEKLEQLSRKLAPNQDSLSTAPTDSDLRLRARWFKRVITGPGTLAELISPPLNLDYEEAIARLEGALIGPVQRDAHGNSLGNKSRTTCLVVYLTPEATADNGTMRQAIDRISDIAEGECAIPRGTLHMGGPSVDNISIDMEGKRSLMQLALVAAVVGFATTVCCLRSLKLAAAVFSVGVLCAGMSLAIVFYFGILEVGMFGAERPFLGTVDAILMTMPAVVFVLGLSGAIRLVHYYRDAQCEKNGTTGAAEEAVRRGWWPCTLVAIVTAVGVGALLTSDIIPIKKFGLFTSLGAVGTIAILFLLLPAFLHRFPLCVPFINRSSTKSTNSSQLPAWALDLFGFVVGRNVIACVFWLIVTGVFAIGLSRVETSVHLFNLLDEDTDLIHDYAWLEEHLGNVVPMELVITVPPERRRTPDEHAEYDGKQYRMTMLERLDMIREIQFRVESFPEISRAMTAATFAPGSTVTGISATADRSADYATNKNLEEHRAALLRSDYLRLEELPGTTNAGRELWRISARVTALDNPGNKIRDIDYGTFVDQLRSAVDPVLVAYQQRDMVVQALHKQGKQLDGAQLCILYRTPDNAPEPKFATQESTLANLLLKSGVQPRTLPDGKRLRGVTFYNLTDFDAHDDVPRYLDTAVHALGAQDALILVSASSDPTAKKFADGGLPIIDVTNIAVESSSAVMELAESDNPRPIRSIYTGIVPLVYKTQRQLLMSLKDSILWATLLIACIMSIVLRSAVAGLAVMLPNVFPIVVIFGALGWVGIKVDIGIMMCASIALGIALDGSIHFLTCFRRASSEGSDRVQAIMLAYERCTMAMVQTTLIGGLGLAVFALSGFTPTQQFGYLMISMLTAALVGDLLLLPAILASPLGYYFAGNSTQKLDSAAAETALPTSDGQIMLWHRLDKIELSKPAAELLPPTPKLEFPVVKQPKVPVVAPKWTNTVDEGKKELLDGPHADLHARLRNLRRDSSTGHMPS